MIINEKFLERAKIQLKVFKNSNNFKFPLGINEKNVE